jgi:dihydroorotate dehydrogenase electron transfer subunit
MAILQIHCQITTRNTRKRMIFNPKVSLVEKQKLLPDLYHLKFSGNGIASKALPGNFVQVKVNAGLDPIFRRPMSIHNSNGNTFEMVFRTIGKGTTLLSQAEVGSEYDIIGPLGNTFHIPGPDEIAVMIAGGVGFPPLHFFSRYLTQKKNFPKENILFLFGMKDESEKVMAEDVLKLNIETIFSTDDGSYGFNGFVTNLFEETYSKRLRNKKIRIYSCGPTPMMQRLGQIAIGFKLKLQISLEGNMPCGVGTCLGCVVKKRAENDYHRICHEGPVFDILEVEL